MSLAREPWSLEAAPPRLEQLLTGLYVLGAGLATARAYAAAFHRYAPDGAALSGQALSHTLARDAGLWAATVTAAGAFILFLTILAARQAWVRLARRGGRPRGV